jgi:DNA-binding transcriptional MocR family regulator
MSYKLELSDLERGGERSITQQLVDTISAAIEQGELEPGEKLPPTRELAELAGVNHLTAVRAYKRLRELGLVTAHVGRGTFVREAATAPSTRVPDSISWQRFALPDHEESYGDRVLSEMYRHATSEELIPLSVGYPSARLIPIDALRDAIDATLRSEPERALQYSDVQGIPDLAAQIAALAGARGAPEDPDDIVITNGAAQGLTLTFRAILRPGDVVACEDPSFPSVMRAIAETGARIEPIPVDDDGLDTDALAALVARQEIKALALQPRLHNPTGRDLVPERRTQLLEMARRHGFFVVEDGVYADLRLEGDEVPSLRSEAPAHVIYIDSFAKTVGGGLRVGWVVASGPVLDRIVSEKRSDDIHSPTLTQLAVARYLDSGAYPEQSLRARDFYRARLDALTSAVDRHLGSIASYVPPLGGGHLWLHLDADVEERQLVDEAVRQGVAYVPGGAVRIDRRPEPALRLSFGYLEPEELDEGVRRLAAAVSALRSRPARRRAVPI